MKKLYVGNLAFGATEEDIRREFENLGIHTDSITVMRDRDTGQPRGFGFVEVADDADIQKAIASLNGKDMMGRAIVVNEARPQSAKRDGGGRGGYGGRGGHGGGGGRGGGRRGW
ncbi:MAG: RNA-binding protein [Acidobacteriota bacterium]|nr:RNA-binding protein [Acidobacteriota bacterium]